MITSRHNFITGLGALFITSPAIVRATSLMPVKQMEALAPFQFNQMYTDVIRRAFIPRLYVQLYADDLYSPWVLDNPNRSD